MTGRKLSPLTANAHVGPTQPSTTPAAAMPTIRPRLYVTPPRPIALGRSCASTSSAVSAFDAGASVALMRPPSSAVASSAPTDSRPVAVSAARTSASSACAPCVAMSKRRRGIRSASTPPHSPSTSPGSACSETDSPSAALDPVSRSTTQLCAAACIQVPITETVLAAVQRRKCRCRSARVERTRAGGSVSMVRGGGLLVSEQDGRAPYRCGSLGRIRGLTSSTRMGDEMYPPGL